MNSKKTIGWIFLGLLPLAYANADSQKTKGNQSPTVKAGRDVTINYGISKEEVDKIVAVYAKQHELDSEHIKALTKAITDLSQGKGVSGTASPVSYTHLTLPTNREV